LKNVLSKFLNNPVDKVSDLLGPFSVAMSECALPQWAATTSKWCYYHPQRQDHEVELEYFYDKHYAIYRKCKRRFIFLYKYGIERPLAVPRLLTIPVIEEERWSRPLAVTSCTLAPLFIGCILLFHCHEGQASTYTILEVSGGIGILLGALAFCNTENARPPQRFIWLWLAGGFFMSIVWFYVVADQLVVCLEMLGAILNINPTILGLTVLAWGNSVGDLVADVALAFRGRSGVQIVIAGCYAGPLFNTVIGLGLSLAVACWTSYPEPLMISDDDGSLFFIIGFLVAGLAWALIMIPLKGKRLSRSLGAGLVLLYCGFLATGMCYAMGWIWR
jgi:sodium/potassium/calcium exchanger 6